MSGIDEPLIFYGRNAEEAEEFIRAVNFQAFKVSRARDKAWIVDFASTAFAGNALRWFRKLPPNVRSDWDALQEALLDEFPASPAVGSPSAEELTPAAPPAPVPAWAPAPALAPNPTSALPTPFQRSGTIVGRIMCTLRDGSPPTYISRHLDSTNGLLLRTDDPARSLHVKCKLSKHPAALETLNCSGSYQFLGGVTRTNTPNFFPGCAESLSISTVTGPNEFVQGHSRIYKGRPINGVPFAAIWNILYDGTVMATLRVDDSIYALTPMIALSSNSLSLVVSPKGYLGSRKAGDRVQARLTFEPV